MIDRPTTKREAPAELKQTRIDVARRLAWAMLVLACTAMVAAFSPPIGSEVLITDSSGGRFVGYGTLSESGLDLELSEELSELRVVVVTPEGSSQPYRGRWNGASLTLIDEDGGEVDVAAALADEGRMLSLRWSDGRRQVVLPDAAPERAGDGGAGDGGAGDASPEDTPEEEAPGRSADAPGDSADDGRGNESPRQDGDRRPPQAGPGDDEEDADDAEPARPDLPDEVPDDVADRVPDVPGGDAPQDAGDDAPAQDAPDDEPGDQDAEDEQDDGNGGVDVGVGADADVGDGRDASGNDDEDADGDGDAVKDDDGDQDDEDEDDASGPVDLDLP